MGISHAHLSRNNGVLATSVATMGHRSPRTARGMQRASTGLKHQNHKSKIAIILSLRQRHRRIFTVLGVLLPLLFVVGIVVRRNVPQSENLPPELSPQTVTVTATGYERDDLFDKSPVQVRLFRDHT